MTIRELEIEIEPKLELVGLEQQAAKRNVQQLENVTQLLDCLKHNTQIVQ